MPTLVDYSVVLDRMQAAGFVSLYYNSGAFGFPNDMTSQTVGWIGPDDPSIRSHIKSASIAVDEPYSPNLARLLRIAWSGHLPGKLWLMPKSHWAYELDFGNRAWLPE